MAAQALRGTITPIAAAAGASVAPSPSPLSAVLTFPIVQSCSSNIGLLMFLSAAALLSLGYAFYERRARIQLLRQVQKAKDVYTTEEWKRPSLEIPMTPEEKCEAGLDGGGLRKRGSGSPKSRVSPTGIETRDVWTKEN